MASDTPHSSTKDCVIVGAGIAGLTAASRLWDEDVLVLEAEERVGGRIDSKPRAPYWVSVGAHMFPGPGSVVGGLVDELGLETLPITGSLLGVAYKGKVVTGGRAEGYPLRLPMSLAGRVSFVRAGMKVRRDAARFNELARLRPGETQRDVRARLLEFLDDRSFRDYLGRLHPDAEAIFHATTNRLTAEPEEVSAGCMVALFAHVWSEGDVVLGLNLRGGAGALPAALASRLGDRVVTGARVTEVSRENGSVVVRYSHLGQPTTVRARAAIVTAPAFVASEIVTDLPEDLAAALAGITYGPFVIGGIVTSETAPMPWDGVYSILTVGTCFNMLFNHADVLRTPGQPREPGGTLMVYGGAGLARRLLEKSDDEIRASITADLYDLFPQAKGVVSEIIVKRLERAIPYASPGRHLLQPVLERGLDDMIFLAGDYVGDWTHMESAALTAVEAAANVRNRLRER